jgi:dTDP-4-amino-4,6-dideoxygalactose transaminase
VIRLARPSFDDADQQALAAVLESGHLVQGPRVAALEAALSPLLSGREVVAVSSGTAALHLALLALDLPPGSAVLVPDYTFPATINVILAAGHRPVPLDIDPATFNVLPQEVETALQGGPAAFLPVHEFGLPMALPALLPTLESASVQVIEDAACAIGSAWELPKGLQPAGTLGRLGCFSFHPRKLLCTGEGGAICTADPALAARLRLLRNHGMWRPPGAVATEFVLPGHNLRLSELHAALGLSQLRRLPHFLSDRARIADGYLRRLDPDASGTSRRVPGLQVPLVPPGVRPNWQSFVVRLPPGCPRDPAVRALLEAGVEVAPGAHALHTQPAYRSLPGFDRPFPGATDAWERAIALPMPWGLSDDEADRVVAALEAVRA